MIPQKFDSAEEQIVEIERRSVAKDFVVDAENIGDCPSGVIERLGFHDIGCDAVIFRVADLLAHAARCEISRRDIELLKSALHRRCLRVVIVNRKIARQAEMLYLATEKPRAERVKGGDPDPRGIAAGCAE